jgi:predicted anti-sigma-YlaC factor YlaD
MEYIDGELKEKLTAALTGHLASCPSCRWHEKTLRLKVMGPLRAAPRPEPPEEIWPRVQAQIENAPSSIFAFLKYRPSFNLFNKTAFAAVALLIIAGALFSRYSLSPRRTARVDVFDAYVIEQIEILRQLSPRSESGRQSPWNIGTSIENILITAETSKALIDNEYIIPDTNLGTSVEHYFM